MDGVLLIDKPAGPTSHDVVAVVRRLVGQRAVGHTGTLDPTATGLLPLVLGRATRLASYLAGSDKTYEATVRLGFSTDTGDAAGVALDEPSGGLPSDAEVAAALNPFRGTFEQLPPQHSAKKVGGHKAYDLARRAMVARLAPVTVTVRELELIDREDDRVRVCVTATAGFYVRALARDLGTRLGCGAHLSALRRTASGALRLEDAIGLGDAVTLGPRLVEHLIAPAEALPDFPAVRVTEAGGRRALHGNPLSPEHLVGGVPAGAEGTTVRILRADGHLLALARPGVGTLHPVVVLG